MLLFNFSKFGNLPHIPSLQRIREIGRVLPDEDQILEEQAKSWKRTLDAMDWYATDGVDLELIDTVERGYPELERLKDAIDQKTKYIEDANARQAMEIAWALYHNSLKDNREEIAEAVYHSTIDNLGVLSAFNADQSIGLVRELGNGEQADKFADSFIEHHKDNPKVLDTDNYAFADEMRDTYLIDKLKDAFLKIPEEKDLEEVLMRIARDKGWGGSDEEYWQVWMKKIIKIFSQTTKGMSYLRYSKARLNFLQ